MSVMSVGKKPKALVRPLGAGNSRAGVHRDELRAGERGAAPPRSEKRNVPGVSVAAQPGIAGPGRPRAARHYPQARPRLWVVPDAAVPSAAVPSVAVPRPRVAPDEQIPVRPRSTGPAVAPSRTRVVRPASVPSRVPVQQARRTRLTRRGRRVVWASAVLLLAAVLTPVLLALASGAQAANHGLPPSAVRASMRHVVVKPGQSLWSIALNAEPQADPRVVIQQIMEFNALGSQVVVPGESLWVPRG
ncbi:MAG: LysM peptidoglycan-binding domain-containing protein [Streptosporangiaceae bacterium]